MRSPRRLLVPIQLERGLGRPLQEQLLAQLREAIDAGQLAAGSRMPSTRTLAGILRVSRGVVVTAYESLYAEGYVIGRQGSGTYVAKRPGSAVPEPEPIRMEPGRTGHESFPPAAWRAAWRRACHHPPSAEEPPATGLPELRAAIARHLRDSRGLVSAEHEVVVTLGYGHALHLLLTACGARRVAVEDPAPPMVRAAVRRQASLLPVPVDRAGARVDLIPTSCDVAVVMPERNDPLGTRMSRERRRALADHGCLVLEPGFDGYFDAAHRPEPMLLTLGDPRRTALVGTFAAPRAAYLVVPRHLAGIIGEQIALAGEQPDLSVQRAMAELLASGCVTRRMDRLSVRYAVKRRIVRQALAGLSRVRLAAADSGSSVVLLLPAAAPAAGIARLLAEREVQATTLERYYEGRPRNGLVLGYGHLDDLSLRRALRVVVETLAEQGLAGFLPDAA